MEKIKKVLITLAMILVWGWTLVMATWTTSSKGRLASWLIGLSLNAVLAFYYSYLGKRPRSLREWLKQ